MHDVGALKKTIFAVHNRMFPGAAGVSPPWLGMRTLCCENHAPLADRATLEQKRHASTRRGFRNRAGNGDRFSRVNYICTAHPAPAPRLAYASRS